MSSNNARTWSLTLLGACLLSLILGVSLGYALFGPGDLPWASQQADSIPDVITPDVTVETPETETVTGGPKPLPGESAAVEPVPEEEPIWAARHLFIALNGQWVAEGTKEFLKEIRPGGVILRDVNLRSRSQTISLVEEIKTASGMGTEIYDLPLIGVAQEGGDYNSLALDNAPAAAKLAEYQSEVMVTQLGRVYGEEALARGIGIVLAPVLDIFETGGIYPSLENRTFGTDQKLVTSLGLAMAEGLRDSGVIPVAKHFPGYGIASFGTDGITVVLNKDVSGLARAMYPFNEAVRRDIEGLIVGHVAVPALDKDFPKRSAALSPVIVDELLRQRWGYDGVVLADEIALNEMIGMQSIEQAVVEALKAGCDAVLFLDPNPNRIRAACNAIEQAVRDGELSREQLAISRERLDKWRMTLGADLTPEPEPVLVAVVENVPELPVEEAPVESETVEVAPETTEVITQDESPANTADMETPMVVAQTQPETVVETAPDPVEEDPVDMESETPTPIAEEPEPSTPEEVVSDTDKPAESTLSEADRMILAQAAEQLLVDMKAAEEAANSVSPEEVPVEVDEPDSPPEEQATPETDTAPEVMAETQDSDSAPTSEEPERVQVAEAETPSLPMEEEIVESEPDTDPEDPATESTDAEEIEPAIEVNAVTSEEEQPEEDLSIMTRLRHEVKFGESLLQISWYYGVAAEDIARWNQLEILSVDHGDMLDIYVAPDGEISAAAELEIMSEALADTPTEETVPEATPEMDVPESTPEPASETPTGTKAIHVVVVGDTLMSLSRTYNVNVQQIKDWNDMTSDTLRLDAKITVYPGPPKKDLPATDLNTSIYVVQTGDSLGKIALEHQTTRETIMQINGLTNPDHVWVGQKLKVPVQE